MADPKESLTARVARLRAKQAANELARLAASNLPERKPYVEQELTAEEGTE